MVSNATHSLDYISFLNGLKCTLEAYLSECLCDYINFLTMFFNYQVPERCSVGLEKTS